MNICFNKNSGMNLSFFGRFTPFIKSNSLVREIDVVEIQCGVGDRCSYEQISFPVLRIDNI